MKEPGVPFECGKQQNIKKCSHEAEQAFHSRVTARMCILFTYKIRINVCSSLIDAIVLIHRDKYACSGSSQIQYKEKKEDAHDRKELLKLEVLLLMRQDKNSRMI